MTVRRPAGRGLDEIAKYASWGWSSTGATVFPQFNLGALPALTDDIDVHYDTENDDLFQTYYSAQRWRNNATLGPGYLTRSGLWANYVRDYYRQALTNQFPTDQGGFGGDHIYGWGAVDWSFTSGNSAWLLYAKNIADIAMTNLGTTPYSDPAYIPGQTTNPPRSIVGDGTPRRFGRQLRLMAELAAQGAGAVYTALRDKLIAIMMEDPFYDAVLGMWLASTGPTSATAQHYWGPIGGDSGLGSMDRSGGTMTVAFCDTLWDQGVRYVSTFQQPLLFEGLRRVIETATFPLSSGGFGPYSAQDLKDKCIAGAEYAYTYPLHPTRLYIGETYFHGMTAGANVSGDITDIYDVWYGGHETSTTAFFSDGGSYTHAWINVLMLGAKYLHETSPSDPRVEQWKTFARTLWNRSSKARRVPNATGSGPGGAIVFGNGSSTLGDDRIALDTQIGNYVNATYDSSAPRYFSSNKGQLPYVDLLFATPGFGVGEWTEHAATSWIALAPTYDHDAVGPTAVTVATGNQGPLSFYSNGGATYDTTRGWYLIWGGGHANYSGREIYVYIRSTAQWLRLTEPGSSQQNVNAADPEATSPTLPAARHTANSGCYIPSIDRHQWFGSGGTWGQNGFAFLTSWRWNPNAYAAADNYGWTRKADPPVGTRTYNFAHYNPNDQRVYVLGLNSGDSSKDGLWRYDPALDSYAHVVTSTPMWDSAAAIALDTFRNHYWIFYPEGSGSFKRWDLSALVTDPGTLTMTGASVAGFPANPGMFYDETFDRIILYPGFGQSFWVIDPETLEVTIVTGTGATPDNPGIAVENPYIHNRFQRTETGTYLIHNYPTANMWEYTPSSDDIVPPPPPPDDDASFVAFSGVPSSIQVGDSFTGTIRMMNTGVLTWDTTNYALRSVNPPDNETWGTALVPLSSSTAPSVTRDFTFSFTAPSSPGDYAFAWQMAHGADDSGVTVSDAFTGGDLADLTSASPAWIKLTGTIGRQGNRAQSVAAGAEQVYVYPTSVANVNHYVQALIDAAGNLAATATCLILRHDGTAARTFYMGEVRYDNASAAIWKCVAGSYTQLHAYVAIPGLTPGTPVTAYFQASGGSPTALALYVNNNLIVSTSDGASPLTGTFIGIRGFASSYVNYWDDFQGGPITAPPPTLFGEIGSQTITVTSGTVIQRLPFWRGWYHP